MQTLLFSPGAYNLAETTRCIEVAKACRHDFNILFMSYGGEFEKLITQAGFAWSGWSRRSRRPKRTTSTKWTKAKRSAICFRPMR
jgi:hypothetical protein